MDATMKREWTHAPAPTSTPPSPGPLLERPDPTPDPSPQPTPARGDRHWAAWEIGLLIEAGREGQSLAQIGRRLDRSAAGVEGMLRRLLSGRTPCPQSFRAEMEALRGELARRQAARPRRRARPLGTAPDPQQITEQYKGLACLLAAVGREAREAHAAAVAAVRGQAIAGKCLEMIGAAIDGLSARLSGLCGLVERILPPASNPPPPASDVPLIQTGPGGDFARRVYERDLCDGAAPPAGGLDVNA